jgi:hypothetical protein
VPAAARRQPASQDLVLAYLPHADEVPGILFAVWAPNASKKGLAF